MASVRKALPEDFEEVYPLLRKLNDSRLTRESWKKLFCDNWNCQEGYHGFVLTDNSRILGFVGLIFSKREIAGKQEKFCNITSGIVNKENRNESLKIFLPLLSLKGYTLTDFTPSPEVSVILKQFGFKELESFYFIILPKLLFPDKNCSLVFDKEELNKYLTEKEKIIFNDHLPFRCIHVLLKTQNKHCYLVLSKTSKKGIIFAKINYIGDSDIFTQYIGSVCATICLNLKLFGLLIDQRLLKGKKLESAWTKKMQKEALFKSDNLVKEQIDTLYSEFIVLNL